MNYHLAKFGGQMESDSRNIMVFICHITLQDYVMKALCDLQLGALQGKLPHYQVWWP